MDFHTDYFFFVFEMFKFMCYNKNQKKKSFYNFIISITQASTIVNLRWNIEIIDMAGSFVRKGDKSVKTDRERVFHCVAVIERTPSARCATPPICSAELRKQRETQPDAAAWQVKGLYGYEVI